MLCKIVPSNGDQPVEIEINNDITGVVENLIDAYKIIHNNVCTAEGFIEYARSRGLKVVKKYPVMFDL